MGRKFLVLGAIAAIAMAWLVTPAQANFKVKFEFAGAEVILDGTTSTTTTSGGASVSGATIDYSVPGEISVFGLVVSPGGTTGGFRISATIAASNSPGTPLVATIDLSSLQIRNQTGVAGDSTLTISLTDTGFTAPLGTPNVILTSTMSATTSSSFNNGANNTVVFNSYLDPLNAEFGTPGTGAAPTITLGPIAAGASDSDNTSAEVPTGAGPYSLTQIAKFTLDDGDRFTDGSSGTSVTTPVPSSVFLALGALPILGVFYLRRRRVAAPVMG